MTVVVLADCMARKRIMILQGPEAEMSEAGLWVDNLSICCISCDMVSLLTETDWLEGVSFSATFYTN